MFIAACVSILISGVVVGGKKIEVDIMVAQQPATTRVELMKFLAGKTKQIGRATELLFFCYVPW